MTRLLSLAVLLIATPAFAHHPLNGVPMENFSDGLLSGIGHPVLGFDHLFFVIAVGTAAALLQRIRIAPLAYISTMLAGVLLVWSGISIGWAELMIVASLLVLGGWIITSKSHTSATGLCLLAVFGLFHGIAFGGSIAGIEGTGAISVLSGYSIGLAALQYAIAVAVGYAVSRFESAQTPRLIGAGVAGAGAFLMLEAFEASLLAAFIG